MQANIYDFMQSLGTLLLGIGAIGGLFVSINNGRKATMIKNDAAIIKDEVVKLVDQTNGMSAKLEEAAEIVGIAKGREIQRKEDRDV